MKSRIVLFTFLFLSFVTYGQEISNFRYDKDFIPAAFYLANRAELRGQLPDSSMAILFSSPVRNRANDVDYSYHQNPNFYYMTGFTEANSILLIFKNPFSINGIQTDEVLFIHQPDKLRESWTGKMATIDVAKKITGVKTILYSNAFEATQIRATDFKKILYTTLPSGLANTRSDTCDLFDLVESFKRKFSYPPDNGDSYLLGKILNRMREIKKPEELTLMRKAITMSCIGHNEMMKALKPGMTEYQVESVGEFVFRNKGAEDVGYPSICGGGENSCILHYETNRKPLMENELILLDMGAEYHGYTADVTRTLPVSGKFTNEQKIIYELVLASQDSAFTQCLPGNNFTDPHQAAKSVLSAGLIKLGILTEGENNIYFNHGTSHYLGLDVHDPGSREKLKAGNVITVEPGLYIPANSPCDPKWWNIGVRIEDDVLITEKGYENLSISCPKTVSDIEKMMLLAPEYLQPIK